MNTLSKIINKVETRFGAPMGRANVGTRPTGKVIFDCRVPLDSGGYDKGGAYWGHPSNLRVSYTKDLSYIEFYRSEKKAKKGRGLSWNGHIMKLMEVANRGDSFFVDMPMKDIKAYASNAGVKCECHYVLIVSDVQSKYPGVSKIVKVTVL